MPEKMESYVNCPACGKPVYVVLTQLDDRFASELDSIAKHIGLLKSKNEHFHSTGNKCERGKRINVSIHVTAI